MYKKRGKRGVKGIELVVDNELIKINNEIAFYENWENKSAIPVEQIIEKEGIDELSKDIINVDAKHNKR
jgi:hypothetical protein